MKRISNPRLQLTRVFLCLANAGLLLSANATVHCNHGHSQLCSPQTTNHNAPNSQPPSTSNQVNPTPGTSGTTGTIVLPPAPIEGPKADPVKASPIPPPSRTTSLTGPVVVTAPIVVTSPGTVMMNTPKTGKVAPRGKLGPIEPSIPDGPKADPVRVDLPAPVTSTDAVAQSVVTAPIIVSTPATVMMNTPKTGKVAPRGKLAPIEPSIPDGPKADPKLDPVRVDLPIPPVSTNVSSDVVPPGVIEPAVSGVLSYTVVPPPAFTPKPFVIPVTTSQGPVPAMPIAVPSSAAHSSPVGGGENYSFHVSRPVPQDRHKGSEAKAHPPLNVVTANAKEHPSLNAKMISQKTGRQDAHHLPVFQVADGQATRECVVSGFYRRKVTQANGSVSYEGALPNWRMVMPEVADIPAWHPLESGCLISINHRKVN